MLNEILKNTYILSLHYRLLCCRQRQTEKKRFEIIPQMWKHSNCTLANKQKSLSLLSLAPSYSCLMGEIFLGNCRFPMLIENAIIMIFRYLRETAFGGISNDVIKVLLALRSSGKQMIASIKLWEWQLRKRVIKLCNIISAMLWAECINFHSI